MPTEIPLGHIYKLKPREERFCIEYLIDLNATQAAIRCGYAKSNAHVNGYKLLQRPKVIECINDLKAEREKRTEVSIDKVVKEFSLIAFSDIKDYVTIDELTGAVRAHSFEQMPKESSRVVKKIKEDRVIRETPGDSKEMIVHDKREFEMYDKIRALENLREHLEKLGPRPNINLNLTTDDLKKNTTADLARKYQDFVAGTKSVK